MNLSRISESYQIRDERLNFFPENFKRGTAAVSTAAELKAAARFSGHAVFKIPVWEFTASGMVLKARKAVTIRISRGEELSFVENENLGIYAAGENLEEALAAFSEHLVYFYNHYKMLNWDKVTGEARRLKKLYEELFEGVKI